MTSETKCKLMIKRFYWNSINLSKSLSCYILKKITQAENEKLNLLERQIEELKAEKTELEEENENLKQTASKNTENLNKFLDVQQV